MDNDVNDVKHTTDLYRLVAWVHARRKPLIWISAAVVAVVAIIGIYIWHNNSNETAAAESLSKLKPPMSAESANASAADPYIKLANDFSGTGAAPRALLVAGGILFDAGKFKDAQAQFERLLREYGDFPLISQAALGVAACLEAAGNTAEATTRYDDFVRRHSGDATAPQAKSALARLYLAQNKPEKAFELYNELARANNPDSWSAEAGIQAEELLQKYPSLRKPVAPTPSPATSPPKTAPTLTIPQK